jgi:tetratricopeptide (TPR) repeat protein
MTKIDKMEQPKTAEDWLNKGADQIGCWHTIEGEQHKFQKHHEEVLSYFDRAIELADNDEHKSKAWYYKGLKWYWMSSPYWDKEDCYKEALICYNEALKIDKQYAPAWYEISCIFEENEKYEKAIKYLNNAIQLDNENDNYKTYKADILFKTNKNTEAIDLLLLTKLDLLEKLSYLEERKQFFEYVIQSPKFEDNYFRDIMKKKDITDEKERSKY